MSDPLNSLNQSTQANRMNLAQWRASRVHELVLPSGLEVKVRDMTMTDLLMTGKLPEAIMQTLTDNVDVESQSVDLSVITKNTVQWNEMLTTLVQLSLIEPKIGEVADDEHILLAEMPADDKLKIFEFLNRGAVQLQSFREGEAQPVETV